jgi:uncharacterized protein (DUF2235 family)
MTGVTLGDKVQDAYAFLAHNYQPGDEVEHTGALRRPFADCDQIFLFGFSRGAYVREASTGISMSGLTILSYHDRPLAW